MLDVNYPAISLIIVNWNGGAALARCIEALYSQSLLPTKIFLVDNASTDGSLELLKDFPDISLLAQKHNLGFAAANNVALKQCETPYVALLNPDAFPEPDWLERLVDTAQRHPDVAAFASRMMQHHREGYLDGMGDAYHISGRVWRRGYGKKLETRDLHEQEVFSACAGAALYRTDVLKKLSGFDEDFFCYIEDADLGFRLRLLGERTYYAPDAVVRHIGGVTTGGGKSNIATYYGHRNLVWAFVKNMPGLLFWLFLPWHVLMNVVSIVLLSMRGQGSIVFSAKRDALQGLPKIWRKRRVIQKNRAISLWRMLSLLDKRLCPIGGGK